MAAGAYGPTADHLSLLARLLGGKAIHPDRLNPFRPVPAKTAEQKRIEHKEGMLALRTALKAFAR